MSNSHTPSCRSQPLRCLVITLSLGACFALGMRPGTKCLVILWRNLVRWRLLGLASYLTGGIRRNYSAVFTLLHGVASRLQKHEFFARESACFSCFWQTRTHNHTAWLLAQSQRRRASRYPSLFRIVAVICFAVGLEPSPAIAHEDLHRQIAALSELIEQNPTNVALYLKRGNLHRAHHEWTFALSDFERAGALDSGLSVAIYFTGVTLFEAGMHESAKIALDRFVEGYPDHADALIARARVLVRLGDRIGAAMDFTGAIAQPSKPRPEYYLERAEALAAEGYESLDEALRGLDEGMVKLGPLVTLQLLTIDLELKKNRYDAALARLDQIAAAASRKETWLARRGEILEQAGRSDEAREAMSAALAASETLPSHRRKTKAMEELEARARSALERLRMPSGSYDTAAHPGYADLTQGATRP